MSSIARRADVGTVPSLTYEGRIFKTAHESKHSPTFLADRLAKYTKYAEIYRNEQNEKERHPIDIELPDGTIKQGICNETTPLEIARTISNSLAKSVCIVRVAYTDDVQVDDCIAADESDDEGDQCCKATGSDWVLWDANRPLIGSCKIILLKFDDEEGRKVFWHSSAHILGEALEIEFGAHLTIGPALDRGFYYDCYMGSDAIKDDMYERIESCVKKIVEDKQPFERIIVDKEVALDIFQDNPFKVQLITNKVPDGQRTSIYRCGNFIDLCKGPHLPGTEMVRAFSVEKHSSTYWLGKAKNDTLQRVYGIAFPDVKQMKVHKKLMAEAQERDHRNVGAKMNIFMFEPNMTPGSAFWFPDGAHIYNKLMDMMRVEYRYRGFKEVVSPNIYSAELFKISGHYQNYKDDMYMFEVEGREWGLKPMNCPGHCLMFKSSSVSYKSLPIRYGDFGVLHRNELSGSLSGLTRVRRFQQDDGHIFCREDQILSEVTDALEFLQSIYNVFGFEIEVALSTRPKKALGEIELWKSAENQLEKALNDSNVKWKLNPGDGAFYGPKIDVRLKDCLGRYHQCGTIQLDFQLPLRFNLSYRTSEYGKLGVAEIDENEVYQQENGSLETKLKPGTARPVIVHRAILGSVERFTAILLEHYNGKLPFWLSPRQIKVLPISEKSAKYANYIYTQFHKFGFSIEVDTTDNTINKKIRTAQLDRWNYMFVVGESECKDNTVTVRNRDDPNNQYTKSVKEILEILTKEKEPSVRSAVLEEFVE